MVHDHYILCLVHGSDCALWWRPDRCGYTTNLDEAGLYTAEQAWRQHHGRHYDIPVPADHAWRRAKSHVDVRELSKDFGLVGDRCWASDLGKAIAAFVQRAEREAA